MVDPLRHALHASFPRRGSFGRTCRSVNITSGSCKYIQNFQIIFQLPVEIFAAFLYYDNKQSKGR